MSAVLNIDTLAFATELKAAGADEKLAEAIARGIGSAEASGLATKGDIAEVHAKIDTGLAEVHAKIDTGLAEVRTEISEVKSELKQDIGSVRTELKSLEVRLTRLTLGSTGALGILVIALRLLQ